MKNTLILILIFSTQIITAQTKSIPYLKKTNGNTELIINEKPFLMFAGELHNSSTGSAHYMRPIWARMAEQNLNTVIAPVSWELIEPKEDNFDFSLVDSMVFGARKENLKLVLLWFGSWKNGKSTYVPEWVKTDTRRFPLVKDMNGKSMDVLSTLGKNSLEADAKAFTRLMKHLKEIDGNDQTVIMVQVENEVGILNYILSFVSPEGENAYKRDYCDAAEKAFNGKVPDELIAYLNNNKDRLYPALKKVWADNGYKQKGTWEEVFGKGEIYDKARDWKTTFPYYTEEIFMAWNYAKYIGEVAKKGKEQYALPMYVNAWLKQPRSAQPGAYPSGGPLPHVIDIWRAAAPAIDFIAPDIYMVEEFDWVCGEYTRSDNPLFIPETRTGADGAARALYAFGKYEALGYAPFGIDGVQTGDPNDESLLKVYKCLNDLTPLMQQHRGTGNMTGLFIGNGKNSDQVEYDDYIISIGRPMNLGTFGMFGVDMDSESKPAEIAAGLIVFQLQDNEFIVAGGVGGIRINVTKGKNNKWENIGLASVDEIAFKEGRMLMHRLNGDETAMGAAIINPGDVKIFKIRMYGY